MTTGTSTPRRTPPRWLNALMAMMLRTPGLERMIGRSTALLTFTGRRTGRSFTTPVSYARREDDVILTAHESRRWWRNLGARPNVELRLAGKEHAGTARVLRGREGLPHLLDFARAQRTVAKGMGVRFDSQGSPDPATAVAVLADTVVVMVTLAPAGSG